MNHLGFLVVLVLAVGSLVALNPVDRVNKLPKVNISEKCNLNLDKKNCCCKDECKCCCCCCSNK